MTRRRDKLDKLPDNGLLFVPPGRYDALPRSFDFVPGMIHDATVAMIYGPSGCSKTFFALHLLCSVAVGRPVFGEPVSQRKGLYVGLEGEAAIKARIQAWCIANHEESNPIDYALGRFHLADNEHVDALIGYVVDNGIQFVVIDTLSIAMAGLDEIAGQHMSVVIDALHRIKRETGACVVALAHTGKNEKAGIRGHSSQLGNVDTTIEIVCHNKTTEREGNKKHVIENEVTLSTPRSAHVRKQRDGEGNRSWTYSLKLHETALTDARGRPVSSPAVDECERFTDLDEAPAETRAKPMSKSDGAANELLTALMAKHERLGIGAPTIAHLRNAVKRSKWGADKSSTAWRVAFKRFADKLEVDSNGGIEHAL